MSSNFIWLPPLNIRNRQTHTTVHISQPRPGRSVNHQFPIPVLFHINFGAYVVFVSDKKDTTGRQRNFPGLAIQQCYLLENVPTAIGVVLCNLPSFASTGGRVTWKQSRFGDGGTRCFELSEPKEVFRGIRYFMEGMMSSECGFGKNVFLFDLFIRREIVVPDEELKSWHSWYESKNKSDSRFKYEYFNAITRPRTEEEIMNEPVSDGRFVPSGFEVVEIDEVSAESCSICMEEFMVDSSVIKLPCDHVFGQDCIFKWLRDSNACPLCRFNTQSSSMDRKVQED